MLKSIIYVQNCHIKFGPNRTIPVESKQRNSFTTQKEVLVFTAVTFAITEIA